MQRNLAMLVNCLEPLLAGKARLKHVSIMQGTKAYGLHIHSLDIPARERAPRDPHDNFYWLQEDYLKDLSSRFSFDYTIMRPPMVMGGAYGVVMNVAVVLGIYAAICREEGTPVLLSRRSFLRHRGVRREVARGKRWSGRRRHLKPATSTSTLQMATFSSGGACGPRLLIHWESK
jgi:hypothetical protein